MELRSKIRLARNPVDYHACFEHIAREMGQDMDWLNEFLEREELTDHGRFTIESLISRLERRTHSIREGMQQAVADAESEE